MSVIVVPEVVESAAGDLRNLGGYLEDAYGAAGAATTTILPAGVDEVSAAITGLFNGHGQEFQAIAAQAGSFHQQFVGTLTRAAGSYQSTEQEIGNTLRAGITQVEQRLTGVAAPSVQPPIPTNVNPISLLVGGTTIPVIPPASVGQIAGLFGLPNPYSVFTPEQFFPLTPSLGSLTLDQSIAQGQVLLNTQIMTQLAAGNTVKVWGVSQGATVETVEIQHLMSIGSPGVGKLSFVLAGDPNNPNGGFFTRFPNLHTGILGITASGATPPNSPYPTQIFTNQYDGVSNFPQYPLNAVSDTNAVFGFLFGQHYYQYPATTYTQLPTSPGYMGNTQYFELLDQTLPLVQPLRLFVPQPYGTAFADLLQPDLRVISDMGYANEGYANVTTPTSIFNLPNVPVIAHDLTTGTVQGFDAAGVDLGLLPQSDFPNAYPYLPVLNPNLHIS